MSKLKNLLDVKKAELTSINAPNDLRVSLNNILTTTKQTSRFTSRKIVASLIIITILITGFHADTLAYYGKKLFGFDEIMSENLQQLNELGQGQIIDKSYTFNNGVIVTLDGLMLDANQLLLFYTITDLEGHVDDALSSIMNLEGFLNNCNQLNGVGHINPENTEVKWIIAFEPPAFYQKKLTWNFQLSNTPQQGKITFNLDRNKAMSSTLKKVLNTNIDVDNVTFHFDSISASPISTVIKGSIENDFAMLQKEILSGERLRLSNLNLILIANGKELSKQSSGMTSEVNGASFYQKYDALPPNLHQLELRIDSFIATHDVNQQIPITKETINETINIDNQSITINNYYVKDGETFIEITTDESVLLTEVYLQVDNKSVNLEKTLLSEYYKHDDGTITHTRTLCFLNTGSRLSLDIHKIKYKAVYEHTIDLLIN